MRNGFEEVKRKTVNNTVIQFQIPIAIEDSHSKSLNNEKCHITQKRSQNYSMQKKGNSIMFVNLQNFSRICHQLSSSGIIHN